MARAKRFKPRNWLAVRAHLRSGAGTHGGKPTRASARRAWLDEWEDEWEDESPQTNLSGSCKNEPDEVE